MIILEGCDNTGKSTLRDMLYKTFPMLRVGLGLFKAPEAGENDYRDYVWGILGKSSRQTHNLIYDRFLISELVYGNILRGKIRLTTNEITAALKLLRSHSPLIIYCHRTEEQIRETFGEREQLSGVEENIDGLLANYNYWISALKRQGERVIEYDFGDPDAHLKVIGSVAEYIHSKPFIYGEDSI